MTLCKAPAAKLENCFTNVLNLSVLEKDSKRTDNPSNSLDTACTKGVSKGRIFFIALRPCVNIGIVLLDRLSDHAKKELFKPSNDLAVARVAGVSESIWAFSLSCAEVACLEFLPKFTTALL